MRFLLLTRTAGVVLAVLVASLLASLLALPAHAATRTTITLTRSTAYETTAGATVTFAVAAPKSLSGKRLSLQRAVGAKGRWVEVSSKKVPGNGRLSLGGKAASMGTNRWRAVVTVARTKKKPAQTYLSKTVTSKVFRWFYLFDLERVDGRSYYSYDMSIGGQRFSRSVYSGSGSSLSYGDWNLGYKCKTFAATIGMGDQTPTGNSATFSTVVDGAEQSFGGRGIGKGTPVALDVRSAYRIRLQTQNSSDQSYVRAVWGDAKILCSATP